MEFKIEVQEGLEKARHYVVEGVEQILAGNLDERHSISLSPGATALAALALLAVGSGFENSQQGGTQWLRQQQQRGGWGKFPGDNPDEEITQIVSMVLQGSQGGWKAKVKLLSQVRQFSTVILSLGQCVVPGLEGPTKVEMLLPTILEERVLAKLPIYGRSVVVAASLLASKSQEGIHKGLKYLLETQMTDGSWAEDIIATSLSILALKSKGDYAEQTQRAGRWLVQKQYLSGGWPAFDQLKIWSMGWAACVFGETAQKADVPWLPRAVEWLKKGQNTDGSYGSTPPFTHPDLDDTAVALIGLQQVLGEENQLGTKLLKRLQNADGSWGTFPSFQGIPPHVSSEFPVYIPSVDVSIHILEALWQGSGYQDENVERGLTWVLGQQDQEGAFPSSWLDGPIYSTAQFLELISKWKFSWRRWNMTRHILGSRTKAQKFLIKAQNTDGGWGSVVETSLALAGLWHHEKLVSREVLDKGIRNLLLEQNSNGSFRPSYRGVYAKGWNYEEPLTTALTAIRALQRYQCL